MEAEKGRGRTGVRERAEKQEQRNERKVRWQRQQMISCRIPPLNQNDNLYPTIILKGDVAIDYDSFELLVHFERTKSRFEEELLSLRREPVQ
jgi:hypothetical protein